MKKKLLLSLFSVLVIMSMMMFVVGCNSQDEGADDQSGMGEQAQDENQNQNGQQEAQNFVNPGDYLGGGKEGTMPTEVVTIDSSTLVSDVDLSDLSGTIDANDATALSPSETKVSITTAGVYTLSGEYLGGIEVTVGNDETTQLILNGATIANANGIAISNTNKKSNLIITAVEGSENTISNIGDDENAIHVKGTLGINGSGTLNINSLGKSGVKVTKGLSIVDATINVAAANHGLTARFITAENTTINVTSAGKDGLNSECDDATTTFPEGYSEGYVKLKNVTFTADVKGDGIQADTLVFISGGNLDITTNGKFVAKTDANMTAYDLVEDDFRYIKSGTTYQKVASDYMGAASEMFALAQSAKGIKVGEIKYEDGSGNEISVTEGDYLLVIDGDAQVNINSTDDAIHTNCGSTVIKSGNFTISTYDDGITSDILTQIDGGSITISACYEGLEGAYVKVNNGTININSTDDAINAASDDTSVSEYIIINGGTITVCAGGDGVDSNGSVLVTGGTLTVFGPSTGADAGLDSETGLIINGGTVFASSSLGMVETPATNSTQNVLSYAQNSTMGAQTKFTIKDSNGTEVFNVTIQKECQAIIISSSALQNNATYTIYVGDTEAATFTISGTITSVGASMNGMGGNMGGQGNVDPGNMGGQGNVDPGNMGGQGGMGDPGNMGGQGGTPPTPPSGNGQANPTNN